MENHHVQWVHQRTKWSFPIVCLPEGRSLSNLSQTSLVGLCPKWSNIAIWEMIEPRNFALPCFFCTVGITNRYPAPGVFFVWFTTVDFWPELCSFGNCTSRFGLAKNARIFLAFLATKIKFMQEEQGCILMLGGGWEPISSHSEKVKPRVKNKSSNFSISSFPGEGLYFPTCSNCSWWVSPCC